MKNRNHELWACALWVEKTKGESGPRFITERLGKLAMRGDTDGFAAWTEIAERYQALCHRPIRAWQ
jgi:hypothetical protein